MQSTSDRWQAWSVIRLVTQYYTGSALIASKWASYRILVYFELLIRVQYTNHENKDQFPPLLLCSLLPSGPECLCLFPANVSQICWHGNLGASTGQQSARALATREATDSPRLPTMPFAYGRCHQGAGLCQLRVTCPLQLLYVIIEPICSAQQGLNGNHEAAIGKMEGKCEEGMGWKGKGGGERMMVRVRETGEHSLRSLSGGQGEFDCCR